MGAIHFTVYRLNQEIDWKDIIDQFNVTKEENKKFKKLTNKEKHSFDNITEYSLYKSTVETFPDWGKTLDDLVTDLVDVKNISQSYVLFLRVGDENFVVTGGYGYQVLDNFKDYTFGLSILSRLIGPNDNVVKRLNDRYFTGNILGGDYQYNRRVTINTETDFNNFFEEIYVALPSNRITNKLGIEINTKKKDYRLLAKDSLKLGKALTLNEFDILLGSISTLLNKPGFDINPFYQLNEKDSLNNELDKLLIDKFVDYAENSVENDSFRIVPMYEVYDTHYIKINNNKDNIERYETEDEIIDYFKKQVSFDKSNDNLLSIINNSYLVGIIENEEVRSRSLYDHFDVSLTLRGSTYWLMNGNWHLLQRKFIENLNIQFLNKVTYEYNQNFKIHKMKSWPEDVESEGLYNFSHYKLPSIHVLDKIFYQNVEMCDLFIEENNNIYFVHVKDGLNGDVRTLVLQIESAMESLRDGLNYDNDILREFYENIINKIKSVSNRGEESQLSKVARNFKKKYPKSDDFVNKLNNNANNIVFVFAYRPLDSHDFEKPDTITSTAAKLSMIGLTETKKNFEFDLEFMKINRY